MVAALRNPACDGLEFDVRESRDGIPILLHDETLERVQGRPERPGGLTADELGAIGVPTLAAVLEAAGRAPFLDVELKGRPPAAVVPLLEAARGPHLEGAIVSSFEAETIAWIGRLRPAWPRWFNAEEFTPATVALARDLGCRGVSVDWRVITPSAMRRARDAGLDVAAWTVRRRATAARLEDLGVSILCVEAAALDGEGGGPG